jgi:acetyl esterase/lipase
VGVMMRVTMCVRVPVMAAGIQAKAPYFNYAGGAPMKSSLILALMHILTVQDILKPPFPKADHRIAYGSDPQQFGDLRLPKGTGPFPVVIVIHGGCWLAEYDLEHIGRFSEALTAAGAATWSIEYRRIGNPGGGTPGTFDDVAAAAAYLQVLAKQYPLDLKRVTAVGHSAGGQLALWLAANSHAPPLRGVVSLAGVVDLRAAAEQNVCGDAVPRLLGPSLDFHRYSPMEILPIKVPVHLIQGARDRIVPPDMARRYEAAAHKAGDDVSLTVIDDAGHFELISPQSTAWPVVRDAVISCCQNRPR